jgi:hypothetical protein
MTLPAGFDPSVNHTIGVNKVGDTFYFALDGIAQPSRPAPMPLGCQLGLVTEDSTAVFTGVSVLDRNAWGSSLAGTDAGNIYGGGLQAGYWIENDPTSLESASLGAGWNSIYGKAGLASSNYTVSASARLVSSGTTSAHPKYGIYVCYVDENNYVQEWIDPTNNQFVSHVLLGGVDEGWTTSTLPTLFDTSLGHVLSATKSGSSYTLDLDGVAQPSRTGPTTGCQIGAVTEDATANYRSISAG